LNVAQDIARKFQGGIMNIKHYVALGVVAAGLSSCGLFGNAFSGGPLFSGNVEGTAPSAANYKLAAVRFSTFGGTGNEQSENASFATAIQIAGGTGDYTGSLAPSVELGSDAQRFYKFVVYEDNTGDGKYDLDATSSDGKKDRLLADSTNGKTASGNRFLVYAANDGTWTAGQTIKKGWNLVTDKNKDTTVDVAVGRTDDIVTQALGGITITY
jgi:hypothetical protein